MIRRKLLMAIAIIASVVTTGCSDMTAPKTVVSGEFLSASAERSGELRVRKDCSKYTGQAGDYCTIKFSNLKEIEVGSRITYASDAVGTSLDTDIILDPPGPGNARALGHCRLNLATGVGRCRLSGGTGRFTRLHARVAVSHLRGPVYGWKGTYYFDPPRD